jgi:hypothetical protein
MRRREFLICLIGAMIVWPSTLRAQSSGTGDKRKLSLTATQRSKLWRALGTQASEAQAPAGLNVGEVIPDTWNLLSFGHSLRKHIPAIRSYQYTLLHGQILIVDPDTKKIVTILGQ